jgi:hypothetical protein
MTAVKVTPPTSTLGHRRQLSTSARLNGLRLVIHHHQINNNHPTVTTTRTDQWLSFVPHKAGPALLVCRSPRSRFNHRASP